MLNTARKIQRQREAAGEGGFTLIELLIVIVVLGILAAIVVFALGGVTGQSAVAACNSDAKTVSVAVSAFQAQNPNVVLSGSGAISAATLESYLLGNSAPTNATNTVYLKSWPTNPSYYTISTSGGNVTVALVTGDPGATIQNGPTGVTPTTIPGTTAEAYEGSTPWVWQTGGSPAAPSTYAGQNICAGV